MIMAESGEKITYAQLERRSTALALVLRRAGLQPGEAVAVVSENRLEWAEILWATLRSGLDVAPVNFHLGSDELAAMLSACDARAVIVSPNCLSAVEAAIATTDLPAPVFVLDGRPASAGGYESALAAIGVDERLVGEKLGGRVMFSSGTTGVPKAIRHAAADIHPREAPPHLGEYTTLFAFDDRSVYLSPAPMYHTAPVRFAIAMLQAGATVVCMERFDPLWALQSIERYRVTHAQFVPTMLLRIDRLPDAVKSGIDLSSLQAAMTGAAPCPPELKDRLFTLWGPVLHELYGASEGYGNTHIGPEDAAQRRGSVGRALRGRIHITDADGKELPPGQEGLIWFEGGGQTVPDQKQWRTVGDIGHLDTDGYLYLTGRANQIIISGGVNIHPQEIETVVSMHPDVSDVAVLGTPDQEYGEVVTAFVVPSDLDTDPEELSITLIGHCRDSLAHYKCPRHVVVVGELPRAANGKMYKRLLSQTLSSADPRD